VTDLLYSDVENDLRASVRDLLARRSPVSRVLAQLESMEVGSPEFSNRFAAFEKSVEKHAEAEEHQDGRRSLFLHLARWLRGRSRHQQALSDGHRRRSTAQLELQLAPILLHDGARLFDGLDAANLEFTLRPPAETTTVVHLSYDVRRTLLNAANQLF